MVSKRLCYERLNQQNRTAKIRIPTATTFRKTEEYVLTPRNMFTTEQPQVSQILKDPTARNKSKQLLLLQRTLKHEHPEAFIHQDTEQQTDDVMVSNEEENSKKLQMCLNRKSLTKSVRM